jgi:hypothetical protein
MDHDGELRKTGSDFEACFCHCGLRCDFSQRARNDARSMTVLQQVLRSKTLRASLLCVVLLLGAHLRSSGLTWGLNTGYGFGRGFHPDEFGSMRGVRELDLLAGDFTVPGAYFEGTFNYYLWAIPAAAMKLSAHADHARVRLTDPKFHPRILYAGRVMTVVFDVIAILLVFLAASEATQAFFPALLAAFIYSVIPIQVIYSHFMRPHVLSNLLCALVLWLSLKLSKQRKWWFFLLVGFISGLGAATRYPVGTIAVLPCLYILFAPTTPSVSWRQSLRNSLAELVSGPLWFIGLGFICGLFLGEPILFLNPHAVFDEVSRRTLKYVATDQFTFSKLLDYTRIWQYLSHLIPYGMYPWLWAIPYAAISYLLFRRGLYRITLPIVIFFLLYLYPMAKGYATPSYARATMLFLPGFCVLTALACHDIFVRRKTPRLVLFCLTILLAGLSLPSLIFDWVYVSALRQTDVRSIVQNDLKKMIGDATVTIGILHYPGYFHTATPAVEPLKSSKITVKLLKESDQQVDLLLVARPRPITRATCQDIINSLEAGGKFRCENVYMNQPRMFHRAIDLTRFPSDMTYPFPTLLLFSSK